MPLCMTKLHGIFNLRIYAYYGINTNNKLLIFFLLFIIDLEVRQTRLEEPQRKRFLFYEIIFVNLR